MVTFTLEENLSEITNKINLIKAKIKLTAHGVQENVKLLID